MNAQIALPSELAQQLNQRVQAEMLLQKLHMGLTQEFLKSLVDPLDKGAELDRKIDKAMLYADLMMSRYNLKFVRPPQRFAPGNHPGKDSNSETGYLGEVDIAGLQKDMEGLYLTSGGIANPPTISKNELLALVDKNTLYNSNEEDDLGDPVSRGYVGQEPSIKPEPKSRIITSD